MVDRNPFSKWDEDSVIYGLNLYDLNRTIRKLPEKDNNAATIEVPNEVIASLISEDLKCRVCLGKLENTLATTCLHRFCSDCLQRTLRMELGAKMHHECPSCRAKLASRRASKPDNKFDLLVQLFSGEKRKLDQISVDGEDGGEGARNGSSSEARSSPRPFGKNTTSNRNNEVEEAVDLKKYRDMHSKNVGKFREMSAQKQRAATKGTGGVNSRKSVNNNAHSAYEKKSAAAAAASSSKEAAVSAGDNKVWLKLYPVPEWSPEAALRGLKYDNGAITEADGAYQLVHPYLRVPRYKSVQALKKYLLGKFRFSSDQVAVDILGAFKNKMTVLDEALTVFDMTTKHWDVRSELVLYFKLAPVTLSGSAPTSAAAAAAGGRRA